MRQLVALAFCCVATSLPASASSHPGARPGEAFTFKFSVGPIESGRARMSVGLPSVLHGKRLVAVHGQAETAKWLQLVVRLDDDYKLVYDAATLLPVEVESVERGVRERRIAARVDGRRADIDVQARRDGGRQRRLLPGPVRDPLSALFALRAAPLTDGQQLGLDVLDGAALWRVRLDVHRGEKVRLEKDGDEAKSRPAILVDGELRRIDDLGREQPGAPRHLKLWLSDDDQRLLLLVEGDTDLGRASLELTSYTPPEHRARRDSIPSLIGLAPLAAPRK